MSNCLNPTRIRAAADGEAAPDERAHVDACAACRTRVEAARLEAEDLVSVAARVRVPPSLSPATLRDSLRAGATRREAGGATTLRLVPASASRARIWMMAGAAAAAVAVVMFALPVPDSPRAISAAEVLDRSLQTLSPATGVELREFDLELRLPALASTRAGTYRIERLVDHATPGRYRALHYAPDGRLLEAISDDPAAGRRTVLVTVDGQPFAFRLAIDHGRTPVLRDVERNHVEAVIRVLQATAGEALREVGDGAAKRYVVEVPAVTAATGPGLWELTRARVVIDAADFQIRELSAAGSYLGEAFSVDFTLRRRQVWSSAEVPAERFEVPGVEHAVTIEAAGTEQLGRDLLTAALRELARLQSGR